MNATLFVDGRIRTLDPAAPLVEALASVEGRIAAIGSTVDLRNAFASSRQIDLAGRAVYPGFVDSHIHLASFGRSLRLVQLESAPTLQDAVGRVAAAVHAGESEQWIFGRGWDKNVWPEDRFPTRADLDPISPHSPVVLTSKDGHLAWVNSVALAKAGIDGNTPDPPGGEISKDRSGHPTGILKERAKELIDRVVPRSDAGDLSRDIRRAIAELHRLGIVGVHTFEGTEAFAAFQKLAAHGELPLRIWNTIPEHALDGAAACGLRTGFGNEWLRVGPVKIFADGALGSQTASMLEPYDGQPHNLGIPTHSREELIELIGRAIRAGFWCAIHAIGDRANRWVLDAYEVHHQASEHLGARHRIEHVQLLDPGDFDRLTQLKVIASMQPIHAISDRDIAERYWGRRSRYAYAWRSLLQRGVPLAFGSDAPVESPDVLHGLYAAVTRRPPTRPAEPWYPDETIELSAALGAYTRGAAFAAGSERDAGALTVGRLADFVVLDRDILAGPAEELLRAQIELTVVGGRVVYASPTFSS